MHEWDGVGETVRRFAEADTFARSIGIRMIAVGRGTARCELELSERHLNAAGTVHGGVIFSLADAAFAAASNSHGTLAVAIEASISYFTARDSGVLSAEAREVSLNPRLATYAIEVRDGQGVGADSGADSGEGALIALFTGTVYRKRQSI